MTYTVSEKDLERLLDRLADALRTATGRGDGLILQHGSKTYGRAFRLFVVDPATGGHRDAMLGLSNGYLGMTRREADTALRCLIAGLATATAARTLERITR